MKSILNYWADRWGLFFFLAAVAILGAAYFFQFVMGYQPCELCLYQRYPYMIIIVISVMAYLLRHKEDIQSKRLARGFLFIILILLIFEFFLAGHHIGVEQGYWEAFTSCSGPDFDPNASAEDLLKAMNQTEVVMCDQRRTFLGVSFAEYNLVLSGILMAFAFFAVKKNK